MRRKEFRQTTLAAIGMMLDHKEELRKRECDLPNATVGAVIANVNRDPEKQRKPFTAADVMPHLGAKEERLVITPEEARQNEAKVLMETTMMLFDVREDRPRRRPE